MKSGRVPRLISKAIIGLLALILYLLVGSTYYEDEFILGIGIIMSLYIAINQIVIAFYYEKDPIIENSVIVSTLICIALDVAAYFIFRESLDAGLYAIYVAIFILTMFITFMRSRALKIKAENQYPVFNMAREDGEITPISYYKDYNARRITLNGYIYNLEPSEDTTGRYVQNAIFYTKDEDYRFTIKCHLIKNCEKQPGEKHSITGIVDWVEKDDKSTVELYEVQ